MDSDLAALKEYVTATDGEQFSRLPEGVVSINISHSNISARMIELKLDLHQTIGDIKMKIYTHTGSNPAMQRLELRSAGQTLCPLDDDSKKLGYYGVQSGMEIHVRDDDPFSLSRGGGLEDTSLVDKYRMTDEAYDNRKGTLRSWIKEQREKDPDWVEPWNTKGGKEVKKTNTADDASPPGKESVDGIEVGQRCEVQPGARRGTVAFVGEVEGLQGGYWVGVRFDEPVGRGDGTVRGRRVFQCDKGFGGFLRGRNVTVGDFPERALDDDDDEEDEI